MARLRSIPTRASKNRLYFERLAAGAPIDLVKCCKLR
jgi:hypothetical protein